MSASTKISIVALIISFAASHACGQAVSRLEVELRAENPTALAQQAAKQGNANRGAILFHGPALGCGKCHSVSAADFTLLGPNLTKLPANTTNASLVQSILQPSAEIKSEYQTTQVLTAAGQVLTGLLVSDSVDSDPLVLRDATTLQDTSLPASDVEQVKVSDTSLMPAGLVASLANRTEFYDLVKYLLEVRDGGAKRARELQPTSAQLAIQLPEYEADIDHAGMIADMNAESLKRGRKIYMSLCVNCHGSLEQPGSLATAMRFAEGQFKYGNDPYAMYQTLTRGAGLMMPQTWMVPQQKYDVIHYLRQHFLEPHNRSQLSVIDETYLNGLPQGSQRGPEPREIAPWSQADYGPRLINTYEVGRGARNIAQKGIALQLDDAPGGVAHGRAWALFDHDTLRVAGIWTRQGFIDWHGIHFDGRHGAHPHVAGDILLSNPTGPGWANPLDDSLADDARVLGRDGKQYGPLPREWAQYRGLYQIGRRTIIDYSVGQSRVLETHDWSDHSPADQSSLHHGIAYRQLRVGPRPKPLKVVLATLEDNDQRSWTEHSEIPTCATAKGQQNELAVGWHGSDGCEFETRDHQLLLVLPAGEETLQLTIWSTNAAEAPQVMAASQFAANHHTATLDTAFDLQSTAPIFPEEVKTRVDFGNDQGGFAVDTLTIPTTNPWQAQVRLAGLDFFADGDRLAVCTWDGDVWIASGLATLHTDALAAELTWKRVAFGLFQPLGLKILDEEIYLTCRDQLVHLRDRNGDGEMDHYRCVNNDHQVTEHFHEFAMGLQCDEDRNFYYAKSARHALTAVVPHHGTLLRVAADGQRTEILATGFRAANGVCLNPDGSFIVTDQEGHWNPKNRINWVRPGGFYGNMYGYHDQTDESDEAMDQPLCWITNAFDRSPAELLWAHSDAWGPFNGTLLNLSYGYGKVYVVPHEQVAGQMQGGMCQLPIEDFPTGTIRGRFSPFDGQLYLCGLSAWATSQTMRKGGLYRIRYTGAPAAMPLGLSASESAISIRFSEPLHGATSLEPDDFEINVWALKRTKRYGSDHYNERELEIEEVRLSDDRMELELVVPEIAPTWCMEVRLLVTAADGREVERTIHNTIHHLQDR